MKPEKAPRVAPPPPADEMAPADWRKWQEIVWHIPRLLAGLGPLGPRGPEDGPPVLVIPGFLATDRTTMELRRALARVGWRAHPWLLGMNTGAKKDTMEAMAGRLEAIYHDSGDQPVLLVGWSLGGLFARQLACRRPEMIRAVVTLGTPFSGNLKTNTNVREYYERIAGHDVDAPPFERIMTKPPVPTLAIWSSKDGIVAPAAARGAAHESDKSVEVAALHTGLVVYRPALSWITHEIKVFLMEMEGKAPAMGASAAR
jgi:hypothetical protein